MNTAPQISPVQVTPRQLFAAVARALASPLDSHEVTPILVHGDGGLGKTAIMEQAAAAAGYTSTVFMAQVKDLPDLQGYCIPHLMQPGHAAPMTAPADFPPSESEGKHAIILDELGNAARMMQGGLFSLVKERRINTWTAPAHNRIFATTNKTTSGSIVNAMPWPLKSRFLHLELICAPDEYLAFAQANGWSDYVTAYHIWTKGQDWMKFDVKSQEETYACPRSWEMVSNELRAGAIPADLMRPMICGLIGHGIGQKFAAFLSLYNDLAPTLRDMRTSPETCTIPTDAAAQWFIAANTAAAKTEAQANPAAFAAWSIPFFCRLPDELCVMAMDAATRHTPQLSRTPQFIKHFATNARYAALAQYCK